MTYRLKMALFLSVLIAGSVLVVIAQGNTNSNPYFPYPMLKPLSLQVSGRCRSSTNGGQLQIIGEGFTPHGTFAWKIWYPNGRAYSYNPAGETVSVVSASGKATLLEECGIGAGGKPDPPGTYKLQLTDLVTDRTISASYTITE